MGGKEDETGTKTTAPARSDQGSGEATGQADAGEMQGRKNRAGQEEPSRHDADSSLVGLRKELEYRLKIGDLFEGPLDLLLFLIRRHELDIFDIPVAFIAERYLEYLEVMRSVDIDVASEYLVMAATLAYIKSRMLLPKTETDEDEQDEDPRAELVRRLLERQMYLEAAGKLSNLDLLGRDTFSRPEEVKAVEVEKTEAPLAPVGLYKLMEAFARVLQRAKVDIRHEVYLDRMSVSQKIQELVDVFKNRGYVTFFSLFEEGMSRPELVVTFLALLEMVRLNMVSIKQELPGSDIEIWAANGMARAREGGEPDVGENHDKE